MWYVIIFIFGEVLIEGVAGKGARLTIYLSTLRHPFTLSAPSFQQATDIASLLVWVCVYSLSVCLLSGLRIRVEGLMRGSKRVRESGRCLQTMPSTAGLGTDWSWPSSHLVDHQSPDQLGSVLWNLGGVYWGDYSKRALTVQGSLEMRKTMALSPNIKWLMAEDSPSLAPGFKAVWWEP